MVKKTKTETKTETKTTNNNNNENIVVDVVNEKLTQEERLIKGESIQNDIIYFRKRIEEHNKAINFLNTDTGCLFALYSTGNSDLFFGDDWSEVRAFDEKFDYSIYTLSIVRLFEKYLTMEVKNFNEMIDKLEEEFKQL